MKTHIKKLNRILLVSITMIALLILSHSCQKPDDLKPEAQFDAESYDQDANILGLAISRALTESQELRQIIKHEALKEVDGDYDVLLSRITEKKLSEYNDLLKKSASDIRIKDLLEGYLNPGRTIMLKSTTSVIDDMLKKNPDLQVSVPVHCEDWDPEVYTPYVAIRPSRYDSTTKKVDAFTPDGSPVKISAIAVPSDPVVVVGLNERNLANFITLPVTGDGSPGTPINLTGTQTESGIRLSWNMPTSTDFTNTTGYNIYRKRTTDAAFVKIGSAFHYTTKSYDDNSVEPMKVYSYYVVAFYGSKTSPTSNYITITAPSMTKSVMSFDAIQQSNTCVELRWENDYSSSFNYTQISRYEGESNDNYVLMVNKSPSSHTHFDRNIVSGKKYNYKINQVSNMGISNPKFDFTMVPYRDNSKLSPVYVHGIRFRDWSVAEGWLDGRPEFYLSIGNVDPTSGKTYLVQDRLDFRFKNFFNIEYFKNTKVLDWMPGIWYDMLTFNLVEYDKVGKCTIKFSAQYNLKDAEKKFLNPLNFGSSFDLNFSGSTTNCGNATLNYYQPATFWLDLPRYGAEILISDRRFEDMNGIPSD